MGLLGQLSEFHLYHIIGLLQAERQTGELALEHEGQRVSFYFRDGAIIHASAGPEKGDAAVLVPFHWTGGKFHFESYEPQVEPTITTPNAALVSAGRRRFEEAEQVRGCITSMNQLVRLVPQVQSNGGQINLSFEDWRFLTLVDGRRDLRALAAQLDRPDFDVRLIATRLIKNHLIELADPRGSMLRMTVLPIILDRRPPGDPLIALMDDMTLDVLLKNDRDRLARARAEVLTADNQSVLLHVEGRPDLADRLLLSEVVLTRLQLQRNALVHVRIMDE